MRKEAEQELIQAGIVSADDIRSAAEKSRSNHISQLLNLLEGRPAEKCKAITENLAQHYKIPLLSLEKLTPPKHLLKLCTPEQVRKLHFIPIADQGNLIVVGMVDPLDLNYLDEIRAIMQKTVQPVFISLGDFERNYYRLFRKGVSLPEDHPSLMDTVELEETFLNGHTKALSEEERQSLSRKFATIIITNALESGASSFSIEPQQDIALVNLLLDGSTYNLYRISTSTYRNLLKAFKRMARLDAESKSTTDQFSRGQIKFKNSQYILAYRFLQTRTGERIVVHIIDSSLTKLTIDDFGYQTKDNKLLKEALEQPGMILVTGPSGSGKSTMLQTMVRHLASLKKSIFTIEDVVGLKIEGVRQFQAKPQGPDKSKILKAMLEKKAQVVVIDEADKVALSTVLDAVDQGALILVSISAPDMKEGIARLLRSGISRTRLASALKVVCTHKIIRKLCPSCKRRSEIHPSTLSQWNIPDNIKFIGAVGCDTCGKSGYQGIINLTEFLSVSPPVGELIRQGASAPEIYQEGRYNGMLTLAEQAINRAIDGATSLEEVLATSGNEQISVKSQMRMGRVMPLQRDGGGSARTTKAVPKFSSPSKPAPAMSDSGMIMADFSEAAEKKPEIIKEEEPERAAEPPAADAQPTTPSGQAADDGRANILLVDDSPVTLEFTKHILEVSGFFHIDTAPSAENALEMLLKKDYHLVITDQEMPGQTGQEFIESIRNHPSLNRVGTILLTGNLNEMSALGSGADGYIGKPTDPEILVARAKSISDIYKRLAAAASPKPLSTAPESLKEIQKAGKVEFTASDMNKLSGLELDIPGAPSSPKPKPSAGTKKESSEFDKLFK